MWISRQIPLIILMIVGWWWIWVTLHETTSVWSVHPACSMIRMVTGGRRGISSRFKKKEKWLQSATKPEQPCYQIWLLKVPTRQSADTSWRIQISHAEAKLFSPMLLLAPLLLISVKSWKRLDAAGRGLWEFFHDSDVFFFSASHYLFFSPARCLQEVEQRQICAKHSPLHEHQRKPFESIITE